MTMGRFVPFFGKIYWSMWVVTHTVAGIAKQWPYQPMVSTGL
jgi:hypothetical protein